MQLHKSISKGQKKLKLSLQTRMDQLRQKLNLEFDKILKKY